MSAPGLRILKPGLSTTIQDMGRPGWQRFGVPTSGALDPVGLWAANLLVGNDAATGGLEIAYVGPTFVVEATSARVAFAGAAATITITDVFGVRRAARTEESLLLTEGDTVAVGSLRGSAVLAMAVEGGFAVAPVMGSVSTYVRGGFGGFEGRALRTGDLAPLDRAQASCGGERRLAGGVPSREGLFRILPGPQVDHFPADALDRLCAGDYTIGAGSDRMGMRLEGARIAHLAGYDIVSDAVAPGSIQIPGAETPIVLLADRQTTGGYPKIATVISADLPALGRAPVGSTIRFALTDPHTALDARRALFAQIETMRAALAPTEPSADHLAARLLGDNLISGVIDAFA